MKDLFLRIYYVIYKTYQDVRVRVGLPNNCKHDYRMVVRQDIYGDWHRYAEFRCIKCGQYL